MTERDNRISEFVTRAGWGGARRVHLAGDASARRYDRLTDQARNRTAVLMDAPPDKGEATEPFLRIAAQLQLRGLSVPNIIAQDQALGLILMEDLGDALYSVVSADHPEMEQKLYEAAVDLLVDLGTTPPPVDLPIYGPKTHLLEASLVTEWYLPAITQTETPINLKTEFAGLINDACAALPAHKPALVLRDFHAENLLWLPDRSGSRRVGLLDFQDALAGHPAYDLVSLLEDARRDTSVELQNQMRARFLAKSGLDHPSFLLAYATLGAQRNLKIIGIFARLCIRDHKPAYVDLIPRVWNHLQRDLAHPALKDLRHFVQSQIPEPNQANLTLIRGATC